MREGRKVESEERYGQTAQVGLTQRWRPDCCSCCAIEEGQAGVMQGNERVPTCLPCLEPLPAWDEEEGKRLRGGASKRGMRSIGQEAKVHGPVEQWSCGLQTGTNGAGWSRMDEAHVIEKGEKSSDEVEKSLERRPAAARQRFERLERPHKEP